MKTVVGHGSGHFDNVARDGYGDFSETGGWSYGHDLTCDVDAAGGWTLTGTERAGTHGSRTEAYRVPVFDRRGGGVVRVVADTDVVYGSEPTATTLEWRRDAETKAFAHPASVEQDDTGPGVRTDFMTRNPQPGGPPEVPVMCSKPGSAADGGRRARVCFSET